MYLLSSMCMYVHVLENRLAVLYMYVVIHLACLVLCVHVGMYYSTG